MVERSKASFKSRTETELISDHRRPNIRPEGRPPQTNVFEKKGILAFVSMPQSMKSIYEICCTWTQLIETTPTSSNASMVMKVSVLYECLLEESSLDTSMSFISLFSSSSRRLLSYNWVV